MDYGWKRVSICVSREEYRRWRMWAASHSTNLSALVREVMNLHCQEMLEGINCEVELIKELLKEPSDPSSPAS